MGDVVLRNRTRDYAHRIAILVAMGKPVNEVASEAGVTRQTVLRIKNDYPELVEQYRDKLDTIEIDAFKQVTSVRTAIELMALEEIRDRLEDSPEKFKIQDLLALQADVADRLGRSKVSRNESMSVNIDLADSLAEARRREMRLSASEGPPDSGAEGGLVTSPPAEGPAP